MWKWQLSFIGAALAVWANYRWHWFQDSVIVGLIGWSVAPLIIYWIREQPKKKRLEKIKDKRWETEQKLEACRDAQSKLEERAWIRNESDPFTVPGLVNAHENITDVTQHDYLFVPNPTLRRQLIAKACEIHASLEQLRADKIAEAEALVKEAEATVLNARTSGEDWWVRMSLLGALFIYTGHWLAAKIELDPTIGAIAGAVTALFYGRHAEQREKVAREEKLAHATKEEEEAKANLNECLQWKPEPLVSPEVLQQARVADEIAQKGRDDELKKEAFNTYHLLSALRELHYWANEFIVDYSMISKLGPDWTRKKFRDARADLEARRRIKLVRLQQWGQPGPFYSWAE
jgi:hypothetical protein